MVLLLALAVAGGACGVGAPVMQEGIDLKSGRGLFARICDPATAPVSFRYNGRRYSSLAGLATTVERMAPEGRGTVGKTVRARVDDALEVLLECSHNETWGEVEYVVRFRNPGGKMSGLLEDVFCAEMSFPGARPVLSGILGDHGEHDQRDRKDRRQDETDKLLLLFVLFLLRGGLAHLGFIRLNGKADAFNGGDDSGFIERFAADRQLFGEKVYLCAVDTGQLFCDAFYGSGTGGAMHAADFECFDHILSILIPDDLCKCENGCELQPAEEFTTSLQFPD